MAKIEEMHKQLRFMGILKAAILGSNLGNGKCFGCS